MPVFDSQPVAVGGAIACPPVPRSRDRIASRRSAVSVAEALRDTSVEEVAAKAPFAHVAVQTARGPHVTPVLYAVAADRLWFTVPRGTLKARVLTRRPRAGVLLRAGELSVVLGGVAGLLDPLRPLSWAARPREAALVPLAVQAFSARNSRELLGFALEGSRLPAESFPPNLLLAAFEPRRAAVIRGERLEWRRGRWRYPPRRGAAAPRLGSARELPPLDGLPRAVAALPRRRGAAVVGWLAGGGPLALPASWDPGRVEAAIAGSLVALADIRRSGQGCIAFDAAEGHRPTGKRGLMLRGRGAIARRRAGAALSLRPERITYWLGFETGTVEVP